MNRSDAQERKERAEQVNYLFASLTAQERNEIRVTYRLRRRYAQPMTARFWTEGQLMSELSEETERARYLTADVVAGNSESGMQFSLTAHRWTVTLHYQNRSLTVPFYQGEALTEEPTAADVLSCLLMDAQAGDESYEDFVSDFGYDDSLETKRLYRACVRANQDLHKLLGADYERYADLEH